LPRARRLSWFARPRHYLSSTHKKYAGIQ
jgi:hypothetical protein